MSPRLLSSSLDLETKRLKSITKKEEHTQRLAAFADDLYGGPSFLVSLVNGSTIVVVKVDFTGKFKVLRNLYPLLLQALRAVTASCMCTRTCTSTGTRQRYIEGGRFFFIWVDT